MAKLSLSAQIRALDTVRNIIKRGGSLKPSERELMDGRLAAVDGTLRWLAANEADIRTWMEERKAGGE